MSTFFLFASSGHPPDLHSFPTRRSSDLGPSGLEDNAARLACPVGRAGALRRRGEAHQLVPLGKDRKSTRLNSSHSSISYAVFRMKKQTGTPRSSRNRRLCPPTRAPARRR